MYDGFKARYTFPCPARREASIPFSAFRTVEQLPGVRRPAVFDIRFSCPCGGEHPGLLTHRDLDWSPLGGTAEAFFDVMTGRFESVYDMLVDEAAHRITHGRWPWTFFCVAETKPRPAYPSAFRVLEPAHGRMVVAVRCPSCESISVNLVSCDHLDVPYYSDREVEVVDHVFGQRGGGGLDDLVEELHSGPFGRSRQPLAGHLEHGHSRQG